MAGDACSRTSSRATSSTAKSGSGAASRSRLQDELVGVFGEYANARGGNACRRQRLIVSGDAISTRRRAEASPRRACPVGRDPKPSATAVVSGRIGTFSINPERRGRRRQPIPGLRWRALPRSDRAGRSPRRPKSATRRLRQSRCQGGAGVSPRQRTASSPRSSRRTSAALLGQQRRAFDGQALGQEERIAGRAAARLQQFVRGCRRRAWRPRGSAWPDPA